MRQQTLLSYYRRCGEPQLRQLAFWFCFLDYGSLVWDGGRPRQISKDNGFAKAAVRVLKPLALKMEAREA